MWPLATLGEEVNRAGGIRDNIIACVRSRMSIDTQLKDIGRLIDKEARIGVSDAEITSTKALIA